MARDPAVEVDIPDPERLRAWLTLANAPGAGPRAVNRLLAHFGDPAALLAAEAPALAAAGARPSLIKALRTPRPDLVETCLLYTSPSPRD